MNNLNLENVKIGNKITTIRNENGKMVYQGLWIVSGWSEKHGGFRLVAERNSKIVGILPKDGKGYYAMHSKETPHFYYSANPKHLTAARKARDKSLAKEQKKNDLLSQKRAAFSSLLESYRDNEECYSFEYLSTDSLEKLTIKQIETLKKWLAAK